MSEKKLELLDDNICDQIYAGSMGSAVMAGVSAVISITEIIDSAINSWNKIKIVDSILESKKGSIEFKNGGYMKVSFENDDSCAANDHSIPTVYL